jgi:hypothetical protein
MELFEDQPQTYRDAVLPPKVTARIAIEAGIRQSWDRYLGLRGIALSIVAALIGWYVARFIGARFLRQDYTVGGMGYSARPLMLFVAVSALIFAGLGFVKIFDMRKVDYTASDVFFHLLLVALAAFIIRTAALALRAMKK